MDNSGKVLFAALVGAAAGAVAGIMLAPASGKETRDKVNKKAKKMKKEASRNIEDITEKGNEVLNKIKKQADTVTGSK